jgi:hypothetical protein
VKPYLFTQPPRALHRAKLDNLTLLPASLLPYKDQWQEIANGLSPDGVLIILPETGKTPRKALERVAAYLESEGRRVTTISADKFAEI